MWIGDPRGLSKVLLAKVLTTTCLSSIASGSCKRRGLQWDSKAGLLYKVRLLLAQ